MRVLPPQSRARVRVLGCLTAAALASLRPAPATAQQGCAALHYSFQPDCFRPAGGGACVETIARLDLGPQIAVWLESADRTQFVDTLMVTNLTASRGLGNRPGIWNFRSGPLFPYGKRSMVLPVWAHARGVFYPTVVMQDGLEDWLGFHEPISSPEPYFCRPLMADEVNVDAITCPTRFSSAKGRLDTTTSVYYPPRADLTSFINADCDTVGATIPCPTDAPRYAALNDLDAVAAATPPYGQPWSGSWVIPANLPAGDYALMVEVNKEFDGNGAFSFSSFVDQNLADYGLDGNLGQPSVVYRIPIHLDPAAPPGAAAGTSAIAGYGDWMGRDGDLRPPDGTISTSDPGSGEMRLLEIAGPAGTARVHADVESCVCVPPASLSGVTDLRTLPGGVATSSVAFAFANAAADGAAVAGSELRYREGRPDAAADFVAAFDQAIRGPQIAPGPPGSSSSFTLATLKPATAYLVGIRAIGACGETSAVAVLAFETEVMAFTKLSGCFVATAAWGGPHAPEVEALRRARDALRARSSLFAVAADLYARAGPAAADVVRRGVMPRALARTLLEPVGALAQAAGPRPPPTSPPAAAAAALYFRR
jgi:hypothetical protein